MSEELDELIDDLVSAAQSLATSHEWGSGVSIAERHLEEAKMAVRERVGHLNEVAVDLLKLIEEHGGPIIKAHATRLLEDRQCLFDADNGATKFSLRKWWGV